MIYNEAILPTSSPRIEFLYLPLDQNRLDISLISDLSQSIYTSVGFWEGRYRMSVPKPELKNIVDNIFHEIINASNAKEGSLALM